MPRSDRASAQIGKSGDYRRICDVVAVLPFERRVFRSGEGGARAFVRITDVNSGDANSVLHADLCQLRAQESLSANHLASGENL
jgi:hypothetical protein